MIIDEIKDVPKFDVIEFAPRATKYCLCIPIINEGNRIKKELERAMKYDVSELVDIIICDGGSTDGSTNKDLLESLCVNTLLTKRDSGRQGAQLRMGFYWALERGYEGIITVDGNNKDSIESINLFIEKLDKGYDFIQGSRYVNGGKAINTPFVRNLAVRLIHAPVISFAAKQKFTDTTNAFRGYSKKYLENPDVQPFRDIFVTYELIAYLSVRATQLGLKGCEVPVTRAYPLNEKIPTKISAVKGNWNLLKILFNVVKGDYNPNGK